MKVYFQKSSCFSLVRWPVEGPAMEGFTFWSSESRDELAQSMPSRDKIGRSQSGGITFLLVMPNIANKMLKGLILQG